MDQILCKCGVLLMVPAKRDIQCQFCRITWYRPSEGSDVRRQPTSREDDNEVIRRN